MLIIPLKDRDRSTGLGAEALRQPEQGRGPFRFLVFCCDRGEHYVTGRCSDDS